MADTDTPLISNEQNDIWLETVYKDLDSRSHPMPDDEKNAYAMAYVQARNEGLSHQEALKKGQDAQKQRKKDRQREEEERKQREEEEKKRQEEEQAMREAHAVNEEALGMSFDGSGMDSVNPVASEIGAGDADISDVNESQMESKVIDMAVIFSILSKEDLNYSACKKDEFTYNVEMMSSLAWEFGNWERHEEEEPPIFVDCNDVTYDSLTGLLPTYDELRDKLEIAVEKMRQRFDDFIDSGFTCDVHLSICGFFPIEALTFALSEVFKHSLPNGTLYEELVTFAKTSYGFFYEDLISKGWSISVDYACLYETHEMFYDKMITSREMLLLWNRWIRVTESLKCTPKEFNSVSGMEVYYKGFVYDVRALENAYGWKMEEEKALEEYRRLAHCSNIYGSQSGSVGGGGGGLTTSDYVHLGLGLTSIVVSPLSLVDAGMHIYEMTQDGDWHHLIDIGIDIICVIPGVSALKAGKVGSEIALQTTKVTSRAGKAFVATKGFVTGVGALAKASAIEKVVAVGATARTVLRSGRRIMDAAGDIKNFRKAMSQVAKAEEKSAKAQKTLNDVVSEGKTIQQQLKEGPKTIEDLELSLTNSPLREWESLTNDFIKYNENFVRNGKKFNKIINIGKEQERILSVQSSIIKKYGNSSKLGEVFIPLSKDILKTELKSFGSTVVKKPFNWIYDSALDTMQMIDGTHGMAGQFEFILKAYGGTAWAFYGFAKAEKRANAQTDIQPNIYE